MNEIVHVVNSVEENIGGPSQSVTNLALNQSFIKDKTIILTKVFVYKYHGGKLVKKERNNFLLTIYPIIKKAHIVHIHGIWQYEPNLAIFLAYILGKKIILSPRGMLDTWSLNHKKIKKSIAYFLYQKNLLKLINKFHVTGQYEADHIKKIGFENYFIVPNGIDIKNHYKREAKSVNKCKRYLFFSRINPKKGLDNLLYAWKDFKSKNNSATLSIYGPDENDYKKFLLKIVKENNIKDVHFFEPLYGKGKYKIMFEHDFMILPSHTENFGIVVAESMLSGTPSIVSKNTPWGEWLNANLGFIIENDPKSITEALTQTSKISDSDYKIMSSKIQKYTIDKFSWFNLSQQILYEY